MLTKIEQFELRRNDVMPERNDMAQLCRDQTYVNNNKIVYWLWGESYAPRVSPFLATGLLALTGERWIKLMYMKKKKTFFSTFLKTVKICQCKRS